MNLRFLLSGLIVAGLVACQPSAEDNSSKDSDPITKQDCQEMKFVYNMGEGYVVHAMYDLCDIDWKTHLYIEHHNEVLFSADTLAEFEFPEHFWPDISRVKEGDYQLLLMLNDRPMKPKLLRIEIADFEVIKIDTIPHFPHHPEQLDEDSNPEYASVYESNIESPSPDSIHYNPILVYESTDHGFLFDSSATQKATKEVYGIFKGYQYRKDLVLPRPDDFKYYLDSE